MIKHHSLRRRSVLPIVLVAIGLAAGLTTRVLAETEVHTGRLFLGSPQTCDSPIDNCSRSRLSGGEPTRYKFRATDAGPDPDDAELLVLEGYSVIVMRDGRRLFSEDVVHINTANGNLVHLWTITGGTGPYKGAKGSMAAGGNLASLEGGAPYVLRLELPED